MYLPTTLNMYIKRRKNHPDIIEEKKRKNMLDEYQGSNSLGSVFSIGPALRPGRFIVLKCVSVWRLCGVPIYFFEASHWPSDHMNRPRPLIG